MPHKSLLSYSTVHTLTKRYKISPIGNTQVIAGSLVIIFGNILNPQMEETNTKIKMRPLLI